MWRSSLAYGHLGGRLFTHYRKEFVFKGEGWACCISKASYDSLSGSESSGCGKRAHTHVRKPEGTARLPNTEDDGRCGVVCDKHAAWLIKHGGIAEAAPE